MNDKAFEFSIRILSNELIAFKMDGDFTNKTFNKAVVLCILGITMAAQFGPELKSLFI